jgi:hypothetical protein
MDLACQPAAVAPKTCISRALTGRSVTPCLQDVFFRLKWVNSASLVPFLNIHAQLPTLAAHFALAKAP